MGPMLVWAIRMVDDFADDILAAWEENRRLVAAALTNGATQAGKEALDALLIPLITDGKPLPTTSTRGHVSLARYYVGGLTGASKGHIQAFVRRHGLKELAPQHPGPCPIPHHGPPEQPLQGYGHEHDDGGEHSSEDDHRPDPLAHGAANP
jgi:hypothetical protein